jgi:guanylate kinase
MEELRKRLIGRGHDDEEEIARRLKSAEEEMRSIDIFDEVIVSGSRKEDFARVLAIWEAAARREPSRTS